MKTTYLISIGCLIFLSATVFLIASAFNKEKKSYTVNIGKKMLYNIGTATVVDYSILFETYKLSNGMVVSKELVETQLNDNK